MVFQRGHRRQYTPHDTAALCGLPSTLRSRPMPPKAYFEDLQEETVKLELTPVVEELPSLSVTPKVSTVLEEPLIGGSVARPVAVNAMPILLERKNSYRTDSITASPSSFSLKSGFLLKSTHQGITAAVRSVV